LAATLFHIPKQHKPEEQTATHSPDISLSTFQFLQANLAPDCGRSHP